MLLAVPFQHGQRTVNGALSSKDLRLHAEALAGFGIYAKNDDEGDELPIGKGL
jgi:hypothetical protein